MGNKSKRGGSISDIRQKRRNEDRESLLIATKIICSLFPYGGTAVEIINAAFSPALTQRNQEWRNSVIRRLAELEEMIDGFEIATLAENDLFVSVLVQASQAALRTHKQEKRRYLRNAVINSALNIEIEHDLQPAFIRFIDELDALHVTFMKFVAEESALMNDHKQVESYELVHALYSKSYRHVNAPREAFELMISDLKSCALIKVSKHVADYGGVTVYEQNLMALNQTVEGPLFAVTSLGQKFLEFITEHESLP